MRLSHPALVTLALLTSPAGVALACANYSQTEVDDQAVRRALATSDQRAFELVSRRFPHHGRAYWAALEAESRAKIKRSAEPRVADRDDLAVAVLKQGRYAEARALLLDLEREQPGRYRTLSNLGVLEKKSGNYVLAVSYLKRALEAKPLGHMGLGDYYLQAARWQASAERSSPETNFLGQHYDELARPENVDRTYLETLVHNDRDFPDVYLVFGDLLLEGEPLLAGYAYAQARRLGHPADEVLDRRFELTRDLIAQRFQDEEREGGASDADRPDIISAPELERAFDEGLERAAEWSQAFERWQAQLLEGGTSAATLELVNEGLVTGHVGPEIVLPYLLEREEPASPPLLNPAEAFLLLLVGTLGLVVAGGTLRRLRA